MEQGPAERRILEQCRRERLPLPDRISNAPELQLGLELFYGAYIDLSTCRTGMGDGPISWQVAREYAIINEFNEEQIDDLHYFISHLDEAYTSWKRKKNG